MQYTSSLSVVGREGRWTNGIEGIRVKMKRNQWSNQFYHLISHSLGKHKKKKKPKPKKTFGSSNGFVILFQSIC